MPTTKLIGIVLILGAVGMAWWGYDISQGTGSQFSSTFGGGPGDKVTYRYVGAAVMAGIGVVLAFRK